MLMLLACWASQSSAQPTRTQKNKKDITIGICQIVQGQLSDYSKIEYPADLDEIGAQSPDPQTDAVLYVFNKIIKDDENRENFRNKYPDIFEPDESKVRIIKQPSHGKFNYQYGYPFYGPNQGYIGKDKLVAKVEVGDYHVTIHYHIHNGYEYGIKKVCGKKGELWRIATSPKINVVRLHWF